MTFLTNQYNNFIFSLKITPHRAQNASLSNKVNFLFIFFLIFFGNCTQFEISTEGNSFKKIPNTMNRVFLELSQNETNSSSSSSNTSQGNKTVLNNITPGSQSTQQNDTTNAITENDLDDFYNQKSFDYFLNNVTKAEVVSITNKFNIFYGQFFENQNECIETAVVIFSALIFLRIIAFYLFNTSSDYFNKSFKGLVDNTYPYFIWVSLLFIIFSSIFQVPYFTWGGVLAISLFFFFLWIIFIILFILFCYLLVIKWRSLEKSSPNYSKFFY